MHKIMQSMYFYYEVDRNLQQLKWPWNSINNINNLMLLYRSHVMRMRLYVIWWSIEQLLHSP